ncbi:MAG: hypothetical protein HRT90_06560, partial [Candidatus Margulisbacteria bacterium]|nr:hypothetical protein [Candidatus Margulisiibacteriota bacterium]
IAYFGFEQALSGLKNDSDWSDNNGPLFYQISFLGGHYTVTLSNGSKNSIDIESIGFDNGNTYRVFKTI